MKCSICCDALEGEEIGAPHKSLDNKNICDDCWQEEYEVLCPVCEDSFDFRDMEYEGKVWFVITSQDIDSDEKAGLYIGDFERFAYIHITHGLNRIPGRGEILVKEGIFEKINYSRFICPDCAEKITKENEVKP